MPDHPFEQLGPERFHEFSQSLLSEEFQDLQCLPIAQPDGGRDALVRFDEDRDLLIFQVKFSRKPGWLEDPEEWINGVLDSEREKIEQLKVRGATRYILLTNLSASAHLDRGSVDRVQAILDDLPLPASCWWRDDLNRRLEHGFDLKLSYPDLLIGADFLRLLVERQQDTEASKQRRLTLRAYLAEQYSREREVRFKQADLSSEDLLAVFIDVPAGAELKHLTQDGDSATALGELLRRKAEARRSAGGPRDGNAPGAGTLLLDREFTRAVPRSVVEGAPGQGKSTVLQYVCQVHRMRILGKDELARIPDEHAATPVRLPFRVDLRELAQWLLGKNPYDKEKQAIPSHLRTLEGFLAGHVTHSCGGADFSVADVRAIMEESYILLALDGLDEVAGSDDRVAVVEEIKAGVERLEAVAASLLTVVTSRPASFVGTVGLPKRRFPVVRLQSITRPLIAEYTERWMAARDLQDQEREELTATLDAKLDQPHIRDLAHNPMQLAILLNLVHRRGPALPDQRTALYSSYMEQFLDREAEKSQAVRDHRGLLTTLHGHIAWLLHCRAERSPDGGRFTTAEIREIAGAFLEKKGYERDLFGDLFTGAFDRVGALVSNVQDTYEFEVQPLREFFTAQFLYQTAPYSAPGQEKSGTRPERLDAMARHPYWLNVTRFYAGSYDVGEISSLADHLESLRVTNPWASTPHPRMVAARLLADWTFQQDRKVQDRVVELLKSDVTTRGSVSQRYDPYAFLTDLTVPAECGGNQIAAHAFAELVVDTRPDRRQALASIVNAQIPDVSQRRVLWEEGLKPLTKSQRDRWIRTSFHLSLYNQDLSEAVGSLNDVAESTVAAVLFAEQFEVFDQDPELSQRAADVVLGQPGVALAAGESDHPLPALAAALLIERGEQAGMRVRTVAMIDRAVAEPRSTYESLVPFLTHVASAVHDATVNWSRQLRPWDELVETGRELFDERDALVDLAIVAAGIPDRTARGRGHHDLFDSDSPLCQRTRYARMKSADPGWWESTLRAASTENEQVLAAALAFLWSSNESLERNSSAIEELLNGLKEGARERLLRVVRRAQAATTVKPRRVGWVLDGDSRSAGLAFAALSPRMRVDEARRVYGKHRWFIRESDAPAVLDVLVRHELIAAEQSSARWTDIVDAARMHYQEDGWPAEMLAISFEEKQRTSMPIKVAKKVAAQADEFPLALVGLAEGRCLMDAQAGVDSVAEIAAADRWFG